MNITVIVVTYSDRFSYLNQVVERVLTFNPYSVIIVDNCSVEGSARALNSLAEKNRKIKVINLSENTGSAYAFKCGLQAVMADAESELIWLLDDDNLPDENACEVLKEGWSSRALENKSERLILSSLRSGRQNYIDAVVKNQPQDIIGENNIFRSFHFKKVFNFKRDVQLNETDSGYVSAAPYGGMFFHKDVVSKNGFPDENYFLYCDDFDFCCRHVKNDGLIILFLKSRIYDIENSWNVEGSAIRYISQGESYFKIYYSVRNRVYLEKKYLVTSWPVYLINMFIYSGIVTLLAISRLRFKNIGTYYIAVYHGLSGKMGCNIKIWL